MSTPRWLFCLESVSRPPPKYRSVQSLDDFLLVFFKVCMFVKYMESLQSESWNGGGHIISLLPCQREVVLQVGEGAPLVDIPGPHPLLSFPRKLDLNGSTNKATGGWSREWYRRTLFIWFLFSYFTVFELFLWFHVSSNVFPSNWVSRIIAPK